MRQITIPNSDLTNETYKTFLSQAYTSGLSANVISNVSFSANDLAVFGEVGEEKAELKKIASLSGKNILTLISALNFSHTRDTSVYRVSWDFVVIESAPATTGPWTVISQSPIQWDFKDTIYYDQNGTATTAYRYRFWNSVLNTFSDYSPTILGSGYVEASVGFMIRNIRKTVQDEDRKIVKDIEIIRMLNRAQEIIQGTEAKWWFLREEDKTTLGQAGVRQYPIPSDIGSLGVVDRIRVNYSDGSANNFVYPLNNRSVPEWDDLTRDNRNNAAVQVDWANDYVLREPSATYPNGSFEVWPVPKNNGLQTFWISLYKTMPALTAVSDVTLIPIPSILEDYAISQIEKIKGNEQKATLYSNLFFSPPAIFRGRIIQANHTGIKLLQALNSRQKRAQGQPRNLFKFIGRSAMRNFYNYRAFANRDQLHQDFW